jgi:hypothetical protein
MIGAALSVAQSTPGAGTTYRIALPVPSRAAQLAAGFRATSAELRAGNADMSGDVLASV